MKGLISWAKSNPLIVLVLLIGLISLGGLVYVHFVLRASLVQNLQQRGEVTGQVGRLLQTSVTIPATQPDQPPVTLRIPINKAAIRDLTQLYGSMQSEFNQINSLVIQANQRNHRPMADGLFPVPKDRAIAFAARGAYRRALQSMLGKNSGNGPAHLPRLNTGMPPTKEDIQRAINMVERDYLNQFFPPKSVDKLVRSEREKLRENQARRLMEVLVERASSINLYAHTKLDKDFPLDVGLWSDESRGDEPNPLELWEGQMSLWIQQDIAQAIAQTNSVTDSANNVLNSPIKHLIQVQVLPGYIGLDHTVNYTIPGATGVPGAPGGAVMPPGMGSPTFPGAGTTAVPSVATASPNAKLPDDFIRSPTGRISNTLYDVRHARVVMIADAQQLPQFIEALAQVNFMTVLRMNMKQVDEYAVLQEGYVYGPSDAVQVDMLIETIWFRSWTTPLMPKEVKVMLGIPLPEAAVSTSAP